MRKYLAWANAGLKNTLVYRADFFLWGLSEFLDTLIFLFIWTVIYGEKNSIAGFNLSETVTYLIGVGLIGDIVASRLTDWMERDIRDGQLSGFLIKPLDYPLMRLFGSFSNKPLNVSIRLLVYLLVALFFRYQLVITTDFLRLALTFVSVLLALVINILLDFSIACVSFWTINNFGFSGVFKTIKNIFAGAYAPIVFFPLWFQRLAMTLPFVYIRYFPMLIYLNKTSIAESIRGILIQVVWIAVLYFAGRQIWTRGLKKYEGVGI
jgi:ABC-2 type transport system permease protein